jgi:hypothetical protein
MEMLCRQRAKVDPNRNWKWLFATMLNDVSTISVEGNFLSLHCLIAYHAAQETDQRGFYRR